ncbi:MAG: chemotaxis response regulator protein-glutamate methylesterase [Gammaproteobacteria bacterium]
MAKIKVLVVDDSALVRSLLTQMLSSDPEIEVVGTASDPYAAREKIKQLNPDVLTLDVEMPRMDGITFLGNLMRLRPMPVVMVSTLTERGAEVALDALALGAVDIVTKPKVDIAHTLEGYTDEIVGKIKMAARVKVAGVRAAQPRASAPAAVASKSSLSFKTTDALIAIGASTGGTEAIKDVLIDLPGDCPGIVITQHIPPVFSASFAQRLNTLCALTVSEAVDGAQILRGHAFVAPGGRHLQVERDGARFVCRVTDGEAVNRHKPSVDVLFQSVAKNVGHNAIGVILTGMGNDGAAGLRAMRDAGSPTIAQDEKTSVVWGMPGEAVKHGAAEKVLPLHSIASELCTLVARRDAAA